MEFSTTTANCGPARPHVYAASAENAQPYNVPSGGGTLKFFIFLLLLGAALAQTPSKTAE
jgi:hypothetical protein